MFDEISSIVPCFNSMSEENKFDFIFSCEECDILLIIVNYISEMYNERNNYNVIIWTVIDVSTFNIIYKHNIWINNVKEEACCQK